MELEKLLENPEDIRLQENQELQQALGVPPNWLLRWGITLVFFVVASLIAISYLIKYPDIIPARVVLTTAKPPIRVVAPMGGKLSLFNVRDRQQVEEGDLIAVLENSGNYEDIDLLNVFLQQIPETKDIDELEVPRNLQLGELQSSYAQFTKRFDEYLFYDQNNSTYKKVKNLRGQIRRYDELNKSIENQMKKLAGVIIYAKKDLVRKEKLFDQRAISESDVETSSVTLLQKERELETLKTQIYINEVAVKKLEMTIIDLKQSNRETRSTGQLSIQKDLDVMQQAIREWQQRFLIKAPISGKVSLNRFWSTQQFIAVNEELLTIVPVRESNEIIAKALLPPQGSGKVSTGKVANLRLDGYPFQQYGSVKTTVADMALVPQGDKYEITLDIPDSLLIRGSVEASSNLDRPDSLITSYYERIPFRQEMQGTALIITEDRRILVRIFETIWALLKE